MPDGWIGTVSRTENQVGQLAMLSLLASTFFGGFFVRVEALQPFAQVLSYLLPVTYGIRDLQDVTLHGVPPIGLSLVAPVSFGIACCVVATVHFRRELRLV